tara:strand:- start:1475 stop:2503 length:1029 start_codon:yes stop_codon:yes gene_type:complete
MTKKENKKTTNFNENDIRPDNLMDMEKIYMLKDIGRLLQRREEFVEVDCPACGSSSHIKSFIKYGFDYNQCDKCETLYVSPRPNESLLDWFYTDSYLYKYWNDHIFPSTEEARREKIFIPRVDRTLEICNNFIDSPSSLLEIGAAYGTFCAEIQKRHYFKRIVAIEPTPWLAKICRNRGIDVIEKMIENVEFSKDNKFDVVVNFEVIEHLYSPKDFINNCYRLLNKNGLLIITCPNGKGFDFSVLGDKCESIDHEHLNYFNPNSIKILLEENGFRLLNIMTPGKLDAELVRKKVISGEILLSKQKFLETILIDRWDDLNVAFQNFLAENMLSSHMWCVAQKN